MGVDASVYGVHENPSECLRLQFSARLKRQSSPTTWTTVVLGIIASAMPFTYYDTCRCVGRLYPMCLTAACGEANG